MGGRRSSRYRRGAARTGALALLVAAAVGMAGLVAALATVGGEDDGGPSRSAVRAQMRGEPGPADLVGAPEAGAGPRVAAEPPSDPGAPSGDLRLRGAIAGPGWSKGAPVEVQLRGKTEEGASVRREQLLAGGRARWTFEGLPPGVYVASAKATLEPRRAFGASDAILLDAGGAPDDVVLRMCEYVLEGVVSADDGAPLAGLPLTVDWRATARQVSDARRERLRTALVTFRGETEGARLVEPELPQLQSGEGPGIGATDGRASAVDAQREGVELDPRLAQLRAEFDRQRAEQRAAEAARQARRRAFAREIRSLEAGEPRVLLSGVELRGAIVAGDMRFAAPSPVPRFDDEESQQRLACTTDALGRFELWLPGPGRGDVLAPGEGAEDADARWRWYRRGGSPYAVSISEPRTSVEVAIAHVGAITGSVTAPPRGGDQDLEVFVRSLDRERSSTRHATARSEEPRGESRFRFEDLSPGRYVIYGRSGGEAGQDVSHRAVVRVYAGAETRFDLALATSSSIVGVLVDAEGAPLADARVTAYGADNENLSRDGRTDENGRFTIAGMYGGPYVVRAQGHALAEEARLRVPQGGAVVDAGTLRVAAPKGVVEAGPDAVAGER